MVERHHYTKSENIKKTIQPLMIMIEPQSICRICGSGYSRKGMTRHISSCFKKEHVKHISNPQFKLIHLHVFSPQIQEYFLHLLVREDLQLKKLDTFLRGIWLECCGHMSDFYDRPYGNEIEKGLPFTNAFLNLDEIFYEYDFGSTTELIIRKIGTYPMLNDIGSDITILSRNTKPEILCQSCGKKEAVSVCTECQWEGNAGFCEKCITSHECGEEMALPLLNSPRAGVCGYTGTSREAELDARPIFIDPSSSMALNRQKETKKIAAQSGIVKKRKKEVQESLRFFFVKYRDKELEDITMELLDEVVASPELNFSRGEVSIWAASIIYALARINGLFSTEGPSHIPAKAICEHFKTRQSTVSAKANKISKALEMDMDVDDFDFDSAMTSPASFEELIRQYILSVAGEMKTEFANLKINPDKKLTAFLTTMKESLKDHLDNLPSEFEGLIEDKGDFLETIMRDVLEGSGLSQKLNPKPDNVVPFRPRKKS